MAQKEITKELILVTGASGFVGGRITKGLIENGFMLRLSTRSRDARERLETEFPDVQCRETGDLAEFTDIEELLEGVSTIVHCAGLAHVQKGSIDSADFFKDNAEVTRKLAEAAIRKGVSRFIYISSVAAVSPNSSEAIVDDKTNAPLNSNFANSKKEAEKAVLNFGKTSNALAVSLRAPLIVGSNAKGNWSALQRLSDSILPLPLLSVQNKRSLLSIQTLVEAISILVTATPHHEKSGNYLLADKKSVSIAEIVSRLRLGMKRRRLLLPLPKRALEFLGKLMNKEDQFSALIGDLQINADRFFKEFDFEPSLPIEIAISRSGYEYKGGKR